MTPPVAVGQVWATNSKYCIQYDWNQERVIEAVTTKSRTQAVLVSQPDGSKRIERITIERPAVRFVTIHRYHRAHGRTYHRTHRSTCILDAKGRPNGHRFVAHSIEDLR